VGTDAGMRKIDTAKTTNITESGADPAWGGRGAQGPTPMNPMNSMEIRGEEGEEERRERRRRKGGRRKQPPAGDSSSATAQRDTHVSCQFIFD